MTKVSVLITNNQINQLLIVGHAESRQSNEVSLVCAAISAIAFGAVNVVERYLQSSIDYEIINKNIEISFKLKEKYNLSLINEVNFFFNCILIQLKTLESRYPKLIKIVQLKDKQSIKK
ncbi:ribosomal-processing cysteine protease Prp [Mycoplasma sp. SG1]|uniref:ribosomal-processing cysteine protease Prp n=1 Tax=Mycoplasma sp. SG1 TaxID=2810348 RepID=UPI002024E64B|nr:ribosomal-processing cysteine protease Prp [Mycoplasma sp. SG1]URM53107.1 ribosomal-processing cysteine protease Prp [Mycoplasma sp. SG1]